MSRQKQPATIAKELFLSTLYATIEANGGKEFHISLAGCAYEVAAGVFNQVDFYRRIAALPKDRFITQKSN